MELQNAKQDLQFILSFFLEAFSRPSFKIFSSFMIDFIQLGKEVHTSSMVQPLTHYFLHRSLSSFTQFLMKNVRPMEELSKTTLDQLFRTLWIKAHSVLLLIE
jgi:hypothetical protein